MLAPLRDPPREEWLYNVTAHIYAGIVVVVFGVVVVVSTKVLSDRVIDVSVKDVVVCDKV